MLTDILMLTLGLALLLFGLQTFLDKDRRDVASEMLKATLQMVAGLFLIWFWYVSVSVSAKGNRYLSAGRPAPQVGTPSLPWTPAILEQN